MAKFIKTPEVIDAVQWNGKNVDEISSFAGTSASLNGNEIFLYTAKGTVAVREGDWITKNKNKEFSRVKPDELKKNFEPVS